jgi:prevent-host-death family protein
MKTGTRDLKNRLSHYLRRVRDGEIIYVTDRGKVIASLAPVPEPRDREEEVMQALAESGLITRGSQKFEDFAPVKMKRGGKPLSAMIIEDRG